MDLMRLAFLLNYIKKHGGGGSVDPSDIAYELEAIIDMIEAGLIESELVGADEDGVVFGEDDLIYIY